MFQTNFCEKKIQSLTARRTRPQRHSHSPRGIVAPARAVGDGEGTERSACGGEGGRPAPTLVVGFLWAPARVVINTCKGIGGNSVSGRWGAGEGTEGRPVGESGVPTLVVSVLMIRFQLCSSGCFYQNQCAKYEQIGQWGRFEEVRKAGVRRGPTGQPAGGGLWRTSSRVRAWVY